MISARRAAQLGLAEPLSAIMLALLGLWPEPADELIPPPLQQSTGGTGRSSPKRITRRRTQWLGALPPSPFEMLVAERDLDDEAFLLAIL